MISKWKKELIENADSAFRNGKSEKELEVEKEELYSQLGKLHAANDFLKKNSQQTGAAVKSMVETENKELSIGKSTEPVKNFV